MSEQRIDPPSARARAVADAPSEALAARAEELAREWALALVAACPLSEIAALPLEDIARYAPAVCASLARALSSEHELASFVADGGARARGPAGGPAAVGLAALAAGWEPAAAVGRVEALRGVLWKAAAEELRDPSARQVADLSDRLASVCAAVLAHALAGRAGTALETPRGAAPRAQVLYTAPGRLPGEAGAALIDERDGAEPLARPRGAGRREERRAAPPPPHGPPPAQAAVRSPDRLERGASRTTARPLPWDTPLQSSPAPAPGAARDPRSGEDDPVMRVSRGPGTPADRRT